MPDIHNVLIIDHDVTELLERKLREAKYKCIKRNNGNRGLQIFAIERPSVVVVRRNLPDMDSFDVCKAIRAIDIVTPIIILADKKNEIDRVVGLQLGASAYINKPFDPCEVITHINALICQMAQGTTSSDTNQTVFYAADIMLDENRYIVELAGSVINLSPMEYKLLWLLMRAQGNVVTREKLEEALWGNEFHSKNFLDIFIGRLRKKLQDDTRNPQKIMTVRSFGYKMAKTNDI